MSGQVEGVGRPGGYRFKRLAAVAQQFVSQQSAIGLFGLIAHLHTH